MSKTLSTVLAVAGIAALAVVTGGIGIAAINGLPIAAGLSLASAVTGISAGLLLAGASIGLQSIVGFGPSLPKPDTTVTAIKTSRPPRVSAYGRSRLYGAYILFETATDGTAVDVYAVHDGKADGIETYYLGDEVVSLTGNVVNEGVDGRYRDGAVRVYVTDGSSPGAPISAVTALIPDWDADHRGDGIVTMALLAKSVKAKQFQETYPQSTVPVPSVVARWQKCPDPAAEDPTDEAEWTWTENGVRHLMHYKLVREGVDYDRKIAPTLNYWIAAAADCDVAMPLKAGGTEARYRSCLAHKHTDPHKDVNASLLATFDGWIAPRADGALVVYSGRYYAPDPDDLIGPDEIVAYSWDGVGVDDDRAVNEIIVGYVSADHDFNSVEADAWRDEDDIGDRGQVLSQPLDVQMPSHGQGRRLAKRKMARAMALNRGTVTTNVAGRKARGKRYIPLHIEEAGTVFYSGPAEILSLTRNISTGGVTFSWVAADPNVDNWNPATEEGEPAAKGDRVAPQPIEAPVINSATPSFEEYGVMVEIDVEPPERTDVTWFAHSRVQGASVWGPDQEYSDTDPAAPVLIVIGPVPANTIVEVEVAYQIGDGRFSGWSPTVDVDTTEP